jgi:hypothetical protein
MSRWCSFVIDNDPLAVVESCAVIVGVGHPCGTVATGRTGTALSAVGHCHRHQHTTVTNMAGDTASNSEF